MYVLLFSKPRNIVFVEIVISHDYSLPLSKLFCLKGSLNLKESRGNFLKVLASVVRSKRFRTYQFFLSFVKTSSVKICRVMVSVRSGSIFLWRSQLLGQTAGWKGITDKKVMEARESKRALKVI